MLHKSTVARIHALVVLNRLDEAMARDLIEALHLLMGIRLNHQLQQRTAGQAPNNEVRPSALGTLEREPLHHALAIVRAFRTLLRQHFRLDNLA